MKYQILEKDKQKFISLVILNEVIQFQTYFNTKLTGDDVFLEFYLKTLRRCSKTVMRSGLHAINWLWDSKVRKLIKLWESNPADLFLALSLRIIWKPDLFPFEKKESFRPPRK